ncbi:DUF6318 family protein [Nocardioides yefusunii]|uniref:DUF6318 family protein n=1 Tax=Nocardioides yefusunii TaxID=2500546 RepID=A0ABW1R029_9ACTN|nr:DUF6318 family protein [Nocardioides yefusunii]
MGMKRLVAALSAVALLGACSAEAEPKTDVAPPHPTPSPSETQQTEEPRRTDTPENTIRTWFNELDNAQATGNTERLKSLITPACSFCELIIEVIDEVWAAGGEIQTGPERIIECKELPTEGLDKNARAFSVLSETPPTVLFYGDEDPRTESTGVSRVRYTLFLTHQDNEWLLASMDS